MLSPYQLHEAESFYYSFTADSGITYLVYFLDYSYMFFDHPQFSGNIFSFNIDVADGVADNASADERIGLTVVEV